MTFLLVFMAKKPVKSGPTILPELGVKTPSFPGSAPLPAAVPCRHPSSRKSVPTMPAAASAQPRIGRFQIERELGRGAQGAVFLAADTRLGRKVALKTLQVSGGGDESLVASLLDEARIVSTLAHPNIVTLYDAGEERGKPYL